MTVIWPSKTPKSVFGRVSEEGTALPIPYPTRHQSTFGPRYSSPQNSSWKVWLIYRPAKNLRLEKNKISVRNRNPKFAVEAPDVRGTS